MKKKKSLGLLVLLLMIGVAGVFVAGTYSKYTSSVDKTGTATVAKWAFSSDNTNADLTINLDENYDASTLVANRIAPGTSGSFNIVVSNTNTEVGISYEITFTNLANIPSNLVFKADGTSIDVTTKKITGTIPAGQSKTISMTWEWPYYTSATDDAEDLANGTASDANRAMTLTAHIVGTQVQPSTTAIPNTYSIENAN